MVCPLDIFRFSEGCCQVLKECHSEMKTPLESDRLQKAFSSSELYHMGEEHEKHLIGETQKLHFRFRFHFIWRAQGKDAQRQVSLQSRNLGGFQG